MRKKVLIWTLGAIIVLAASVNVGMNLFGDNAERELFLANVEALSDFEIDFPDSDYFHCRCHSELNGWCLGGNAVSLRRSCHKEPASGGNNINCHDWDANCH